MISIRIGRREFAVGHYGDLCLWGADHMTAAFYTGPPWRLSWAVLTFPPARRSK